MDHISRRLMAGRRPANGLFRTLLALLQIRRERRRLEGLSDATLRDIGLSRDEARAEAARPLWDAPDHWRLR